MQREKPEPIKKPKRPRGLDVIAEAAEYSRAVADLGRIREFAKLAPIEPEGEGDQARFIAAHRTEAVQRIAGLPSAPALQFATFAVYEALNDQPATRVMIEDLIDAAADVVVIPKGLHREAFLKALVALTPPAPRAVVAATALRLVRSMPEFPAVSEWALLVDRELAHAQSDVAVIEFVYRLHLNAVRVLRELGDRETLAAFGIDAADPFAFDEEEADHAS